MANAKRIKIINYLFLLFMVLFPLGQLIRINIGGDIRIQPIDLVVFPSIFLIKKRVLRIPEVKTALTILIFSLIFSFSLFPVEQLFTGALYLIRLISYIFFYFILKDLLHKQILYRELVPKFLISIAMITALLGWVQYLLLPDLRAFYEFGWDDHLYRLVGSFLDPAFTGIVVVLASLLSLGLYLKEKGKLWFIITVFFLLTLSFTYSRASYLALIIGGTYMLIIVREFKKIVLGLVLFAIIILLLPRPSSEGAHLERTASANSRLVSYQEMFQVAKLSPLFGVGVNNICQAKITYLKLNTPTSHSCSGSDSSILLVLSTTGVIGLITLSTILLRKFTNINKSHWSSLILTSTVIAVLVHSQFNNSLVYPWVMGWVSVLAAWALRVKS